MSRTQEVEIYSLDNSDTGVYRAVGEIDNDKIFFAYTEQYNFETESWDYDCVTQYQRDCVAVPNLERDPDFLHWLGNVAGFALKTESSEPKYYDDLEFFKNHENSNCTTHKKGND